MALKKCIKCGKELEDNCLNFVTYKVRGSGSERVVKTTNRCKECVKEIARETRRKKKREDVNVKGKLHKLIAAGDEMKTCSIIAEDYLKVRCFKSLERRYGCPASSLSAYIGRREAEFAKAYPELYKKFELKRRMSKRENKFKRSKSHKNTFKLSMLEELPSPITYFELNDWASHTNECHFTGLELIELCEERGIKVID